MSMHFATPSLLITGAVLMLIFLVIAAWTETFPEEDFQFTKVSQYHAAPIETPEYICEYWTPDALDLVDEQEKMATPTGRHAFEPIDNLITPIVPQWYGNKQESI